MSVPPNSDASPALKPLDAYKPGDVIPDITPEERRANRPYARPICNTLRLFHFCGHAACRKARACRGDPNDCLDAAPRKVPSLVFEWAWRLYEPNDPVSPEVLKLERPTEHLAYESWIAGLEAGERSRAVR